MRNSDQHRSTADKQRVVEDFQTAYVLKVAGSDQYFLQACPISQYKYIRACIAKSETPQLMLMSKRGVFDSIAQSDFHQPAYMRKNPALPARNTTKLWRLEGAFQVYVQSATYVNVKEADLIYVRVGLFHGTEPLGQVRQTKEVSHSIPRWEEWIKFDDIFYIDLPRATKLCVSVCAVKRRKNREETTMLCWGNIGKSLGRAGIIRMLSKHMKCVMSVSTLCLCNKLVCDVSQLKPSSIGGVTCSPTSSALTCGTYRRAWRTR